MVLVMPAPLVGHWLVGSASSLVIYFPHHLGL